MKILRCFLIFIVMFLTAVTYYVYKGNIVNWRSIASPNPSINITLSSDHLTQANTTTTLTIINTGNVVLTDVSIPVITPVESYLSLASTTCTGSLAIGGSCSYTINYTPLVLAHVVDITLGGIHGNYKNKNQTLGTSFINHITVNVSSMAEGLISSNSVLVLNENTSNGTVVFTNTGNEVATIKTVSFMLGSNSNLVIDSNDCNGKNLAPNLSCDVKVKLNSIAVSGSGSGVLQMIYDNHNSLTNAVSSNSSISWVIAKAPSLQANLVSSRLVI